MSISENPVRFFLYFALALAMVVAIYGAEMGSRAMTAVTGFGDVAALGDNQNAPKHEVYRKTVAEAGPWNKVEESAAAAMEEHTDVVIQHFWEGSVRDSFEVRTTSTIDGEKLGTLIHNTVAKEQLQIATQDGAGSFITFYPTSHTTAVFVAMVAGPDGLLYVIVADMHYPQNKEREG